jgi:hypothetical protein
MSQNSPLIFNEIKHDVFDELIVPMMVMQPKLILAGSLSLEILGITRPKDKINDIDFGVTEPLTLDELIILMDFFKLKIRPIPDYGLTENPNSTIDLKEFIKSDLLSLKQNIIISEPNAGTHGGGTYEVTKEKIDIFNTKIPNIKNDIIKYMRSDIEIKITHPSIPMMHKFKYAYTLGHSSNKHYLDILEIIAIHGKMTNKLENIARHRYNYEQQKENISENTIQ